MLHITKGFNLIYWTKNDKDMVNLGDYIGKIFFDKAKINSNENGKPAFITGSLLEHYWRKQFKQPIVVWGAGSIGYDFPVFNPKDQIFAVRGPLTRKWLNLSPDVALGDPALLMPRVYYPKSLKLGAIKVFNYINAHHGLSMRVNKWHWQGIIQNIVSAEIVLANTLHAAILAQAYNIPWAIYQFNDQNPFPNRWQDWFAYINLPPEAIMPINTVDSAYNWWNKWSKLIQMPNPQLLIDSCPWSEMRKIFS